MLPLTDAGEGPAIVLLHAGVADRSMWDDHVAPLAAAGFRVLAVDLPGFGDAVLPAGPETPWLDVLATLDELGIDQATVVGNSFGAAVALRAAILAPERFTRLALVSPPPLGGDPSPELAAAWTAEEAAIERGDLDAAVQSVLDAWLLPGSSPALRERVATMQRRAFEMQAGAPPEPDPFDDPTEQPDAFARLTMPTLITVGAHEFIDFTHAAAALAKAIRGSRLETLAGAGHLAPLETPEEFRELLLAWMRG